MKDHLIFDTSSKTTVEDTDSIGAYVRADKSGALITHHAMQKPSSGSFAFLDADVTPASDTIAESAHGFQTGDRIQLTTSGVLPAGLSLATDYYVIRVDANTIKLALSQYNAEWNVPVDITAAAGGGTHTLTGFEVEARALDVWIANPSIAITDGGGSITVDGTVAISGTVAVTQSTSPWVVSAVDLDIRDLVFATDKVDVSGSVVDLSATTLAALENITVDTQLSYLEDSAHVSGDKGIMALAVRNDVEGSLVSADGDYGSLQLDALGRLRVAADISVVSGHEKLEDAVHVSADVGSYVLAVRQDVLAVSTSADGDYASFKVNAAGALYVDAGTITVNDAALANIAIASAAKLLASANTAENIITSPLSARKYLWIYNKDNQAIFVGQSGVTAANGFPISPGSYMELRAGAAVDIEFVSAKINHEIRTLEIS